MRTDDRDRRSGPHRIPDAWPALLSIEQLCAYVGLSETTLKRVYPHPPRELGANVLRYSRSEADDWIAQLPPRLGKHNRVEQDDDARAEVDLPPTLAVDRGAAAIEAARQRAVLKGGGGCRTPARSS